MGFHLTWPIYEKGSQKSHAAQRNPHGPCALEADNVCLSNPVKFSPAEVFLKIVPSRLHERVEVGRDGGNRGRYAGDVEARLQQEVRNGIVSCG